MQNHILENAKTERITDVPTGKTNYFPDILRIKVRAQLVLQFPARCSTQVLLCLFLVCCGCDTSYIVSVHTQCQASIYTLSLCCGHSWQVRLAKQETLTLPGHLVSPLVCRGPWMSTVMLYCWCHSDSASVLLYFTLNKHANRHTSWLQYKSHNCLAGI